MENTDILVIGGCAAGMSGAAAARRENKNLKIVVLEKGKFISYGSCAIPYYIEGIIPDWKPLVHHTPEEFKKERNIDVRTHAEAVKLITETKTVFYLHEGQEKEIKYDKLLIATGGAPFDPFNVRGKYENLFLCRNVEDAIAIRKSVEGLSGKKAVVLGSGYIGLELACAFKNRGLEVEILERDNSILRGFLPVIANEALAYLDKKGIHIHLSESVTGFAGEGKVEKVITEKGEYSADIVLMAIGAKPANEFLKNSGLGFGSFGELKIDKSMRTNIMDIWAAGDCAGTYNAFTGEYTYFPLAQTANRQGKIAGENMAAGKNITLKGVVKSQAMKLFDMELGSVGLSMDEAIRLGYTPEIQTIDSFTKAYKHLGGGKIKISLIYDNNSGTILGVQLMGAEGTGLRVNVFAAAIYNRMTVEDFWNMDLVYVPPIAPVYDPTLVAARAAMNQMGI